MRIDLPKEMCAVSQLLAYACNTWYLACCKALNSEALAFCQVICQSLDSLSLSRCMHK